MCNASEVDVTDHAVGHIARNDHVTCDHSENHHCFNSWAKSCDGSMLTSLITALKEVTLDLYNSISCIPANGEPC